ncbi:alpha/beta hydrolase fold domain-containing protein [Gordonia sp. NPDC003424]
MTDAETVVAEPRTLTYRERPTGPLLLDLYLPDQPSGTTPVVIWLHGGGWFTGDRTLAPDLWTYFADAGLAMASIDYRLTGEAIFPAQLHDVRAAIRFLRRNAVDLGIDPGRIGIWGASAGGHLAALAGLTGHLPTLPGEDAEGDASVQAVAESYGPVDLTEADVAPGAPLPGTDPRNSPETRLIGGLPDEQPARARDASPHLQVTPAAPPFQISHGTGDVLVPTGTASCCMRH